MGDCDFVDVMTDPMAPDAHPSAHRPLYSARDALAALETSGCLALQVTADRQIINATQASADLLGYPLSYLTKASLLDLVVPESRASLDNMLDEAWSSHSSCQQPLHFSNGFNASRWVDVCIRADYDADCGPCLIVVGYDITDWRQKVTKLMEASLHDPLTGLGNRSLMRQTLSRRLTTARNGGGEFAVALLDLDGFKTINDSLGHDVGDTLLKEVSTRLRDAARSGDVVARMGGDEFVLLLDNGTSAEKVLEIVERVLQAFRQPFHIAGCQLRVTTSLGLAYSGDANLSESALLKRADLAMYAAKEQGKNRYFVYTPALEQHLDQQFKLEQRMFNAVQNGEFSLHYQPIFDPRTKEVRALEALMRWDSPDGAVSPAVFIPLAEHNGLINLLGDWAIRSACAQLKLWHEMGIIFDYISVNVSPVQFRHPAFAEGLKQAVTDSGICAQKIVLEITEGALMTNPIQAESLLNDLRSYGFRFAVDDFGTGYSSLAYLRRFPLTALKIDRSFVADMLNSQNGQKIVYAVLSLARELGLTVIAEGVEIEEQAILLADHGCKFAQGWLLSKALTTGELEEQFLVKRQLKLSSENQQ